MRLVSGAACAPAWVRRVSVFLGLLLSSLLVVAPFFTHYRSSDSPSCWGFSPPGNHDLVSHLDYVEEFDEALRSGVLYPRWAAGLNDGWGVPLFNFYHSFPFYFTSGVRCFVANGVCVLFVSCVLFALASALGFYCFAQLRCGRVAAFAGAIAYLVTPYYVQDLYARGAIPEFSSFIWLPWVALFCERLAERWTARHTAGLAASFGLLLYSHLGVAYLVAVSLSLWHLLRAIADGRPGALWRPWPGLALGCGVGCPAWLPAVWEVRFLARSLHREQTMLDYSNALAFAGGSRFVGRVVEPIWVLYLALLVMGLAYVVWARRSERTGNSAASSSAAWLGTGIFALGMASLAAKPLVGLVPLLESILYPMRWLAVSGFALSALVAHAVEKAVLGSDPTSRLLPWKPAAIFAATVLASTLVLSMLGSNYLLSRSSRLNVSAADYSLYLTTWADGMSPQRGTADSRRVRFLEESPRREVPARVDEWRPQYRRITVSMDRRAELAIKTLYFPGWSAMIDGREMPVHVDPKSGGILLVVPAGESRIELRFQDTPARKWAWKIFWASVLLVGVSWCIEWRQERPALRMESRF